MSGRGFAAFALRLAWQQTIRRARRTTLGFIGITGGIVMVLIQLGFQTALYDSALRLHRRLAGAVVIVPAEFSTFQNIVWFPRDWLRLAEAHPAVAEASPLWLAQLPVRNVDDQTMVPSLLIGVDLDRPGIRLAEFGPAEPVLRQVGAALFDADSQRLYGDILTPLRRDGRVPMRTALPGPALQRSLTVRGEYAMGGTIVMPGTMLVSLATFSDLTRLPGDWIVAGVVALRADADPARVAADLVRILPPEVTAMTTDAFIERERDFWRTKTPIGFLFNFGAAVGFFVAAIYTWQVLFQIVEENLSEYAVLKGMGYPPWFFRLVVCTTGVILSAAVAPIAMAIGAALYAVCAAATQLDLVLTPGRVFGVSGIAMALAVVAGLAAVRRLRNTDLASLL